MVSTRLWRSKKFRALTSHWHQLVFIYILTSEHQNSAGSYRMPLGYALADTGWPEREVASALEGLAEGKLISYDSETEELFVHGWFVQCPTMNNSHEIGTRRIISKIESEAIRTLVTEEFEAQRDTRSLDQNPKVSPALRASLRSYE